MLVVEVEEMHVSEAYLRCVIVAEVRFVSCLFSFPKVFGVISIGCSL